MRNEFRVAAEWPLAAVMIVFGTLFALLTPPFGVPDETAHWLHAVAASRQLRAWKPSPEIRVPDAAIDFLDAHAPAGDFRKITNQPRFPIVEKPTSRQLNLGPAANYSGLAYAFPAAGLAAARVLHLNTPASFRFGRLTSMLLCSLITLGAIRRASGCKAFLALVALTPMAVALRSSYSPDAIVVSLSILLASLVLHSDGRSAAAVGFMAAAVLVAIKPPYLPLAFLAAVPVSRAFRDAKAKRAASALSIAILTGIAVALTVAGSQANASARSRYDASVDPAAQMAEVREHPIQTAAIIGRDLSSKAWQYTREAIGILGWLDIPLPRGVYLAFAIAAILAFAASHSSITWPVRIAGFAAIVATIAAIALGMYLMWTAVGAADVGGIQGRYFLPAFAFAAVLTRPGSRFRVDENASVPVVTVFASVVLIIALRGVMAHYPS